MGWLAEKLKSKLKSKTVEHLPLDYHKRTEAKLEAYRKEKLRLAKIEGKAQARSERAKRKSGGFSVTGFFEGMEKHAREQYSDMLGPAPRRPSKRRSSQKKSAVRVVVQTSGKKKRSKKKKDDYYSQFLE